MRVLLVDDHVLFREGLCNLLTSEGFEVAGVASDGLEALVQARRLHPDVILMDVQMPGCGGLAATRLIKAEMPECKIVMLTISEEEQDLFEAVKSGAAGYLLKRVDADSFFAYLADLEAGHPPFSPGLAARILEEFARLATGIPPQAPSSRQAVAEAGDGVLSPRQVQILTLVAQGKTYRQAAEIIGISERTVKYHMGVALERLHLEKRSQVIAYAAQMGLLPREQPP